MTVLCVKIMLQERHHYQIPYKLVCRILFSQTSAEKQQYQRTNCIVITDIAINN